MSAISETRQLSPLTPRPLRNGAKKIGWFFLNNGIIIALVVEVLIFALLGKEKFWNPDVLAIILQSTSAVGIIMPFYAMSMISGIVDFGGAPLTAVLFAIQITFFHIAWPLALVTSLSASILMGLINSMLVIRFRIPPIVTTLITGSVVVGLGLMLAQKFGTAMQIKLSVPFMRQLWTIKPLGLPLTVYIMFALYIFMYVLLNHTRLGSHLYAVGANPDAANRAGIKSVKLVIFVFLTLNLMTSLANIIYSVRVLNAGPYVNPYITAGAGASGVGITIMLVAGLFAGIGLYGGTGRVEFTLVGLLFFGVLTVGMAVVGCPAQLRVAVDGLSIVGALLLDALRRHFSSR